MYVGLNGFRASPWAARRRGRGRADPRQMNGSQNELLHDTTAEAICQPVFSVPGWRQESRPTPVFCLEVDAAGVLVYNTLNFYAERRDRPCGSLTAGGIMSCWTAVEVRSWSDGAGICWCGRTPRPSGPPWGGTRAGPGPTGGTSAPAPAADTGTRGSSPPSGRSAIET